MQRALFVLLFQTTSQKTSQKETDFREAPKPQTGAKTQAEGLATTQKSPQEAEAGWGGERGRGQGAVPCSRGRGGGRGGGADRHTGHAEGTGKDPLLPRPRLQELLPHGEEHLPGRIPIPAGSGVLAMDRNACDYYYSSKHVRLREMPFSSLMVIFV